MDDRFVQDWITRIFLPGQQVWITGTELAPFRGVAEKAAMWEIAQGVATRL